MKNIISYLWIMLEFFAEIYMIVTNSAALFIKVAFLKTVTVHGCVREAFLRVFCTKILSYIEGETALLAVSCIAKRALFTHAALWGGTVIKDGL